MATAEADFVERLARLALFTGVPRPELASLASQCEQASFGEGVTVLRRGDEARALYIILEGEVGIVIDDVEHLTLPTGSFFGEVSLLLGEPAIADVVTKSPLDCLVVTEVQLDRFLLANPRVTVNMLRTEARRVRTATEWHN